MFICNNKTWKHIPQSSYPYAGPNQGISNHTFANFLQVNSSNVVNYPTFEEYNVIRKEKVNNFN